MRSTQILLLAVLLPTLTRADWPQAAGPNGNFRSTDPAPATWSVVHDKNIAWKITLPETGQGIPVTVDNKLFFSTMKPVEADSELGKDIIAWCCDAMTGDVLWKREITGRYPLRLSGCFSDSSAPPAVCDGERVVFINASGTIACFDMEGKPLWSKEILSVGRTLPFLHEGNLVFTRQVYPPEPKGSFPHKYKDSPKDMWTQLQAIRMKDGEATWTSDCGINMGNAVLPQILKDGRAVAVAGRGGGHGPPEKPIGISLIDLKDGSTLWTLPVAGFMSTMSYSIRNDELHVFHANEHLSIDAPTGRILRRTSIVKDVSVRHWNNGSRVTKTETFPASKKGRMITQGSNLLVGPWHYFRSYTKPWLGRVHVENSSVEYLELPLQLSRTPEKEDELLWFVKPEGKKGLGMKDQGFAPNDMKNSRDLTVFGDKRSKGSGWGHAASAMPTVAGPHLYVPVMNGTVYVVNWNAEKLTENAVVAINDLGPAGRSWNRTSVSFSGGHAFAQTIRELICIGE